MAPFKHRKDEKDPFPSRMKGKSFFTKAAVINAEFLSFHLNRQSEFFYHFYLFTKLFEFLSVVKKIGFFSFLFQRKI